MFLSQNDEVQNQKLKVQEVVIRYEDTQLYATSGSDSIILIKEPVSAIVSVTNADDSASAVVVVQAANLSIVDSVAFTSGGDKGGIKAASIQMAAHDSFTVRYITTN